MHPIIHYIASTTGLSLKELAAMSMEELRQISSQIHAAATEVQDVIYNKSFDNEVSNFAATYPDGLYWWIEKRDVFHQSEVQVYGVYRIFHTVSTVEFDTFQLTWDVTSKTSTLSCHKAARAFGNIGDVKSTIESFNAGKDYYPIGKPLFKAMKGQLEIAYDRHIAMMQTSLNGVSETMKGLTNAKNK